MADQGLGDVWTFLFPRFDMLLSGDVEMITPLLVMLIWGIAGAACVFAGAQARRARALTMAAHQLLEGLEQDNLQQRRGEVHLRSQASPPAVGDAWREFDETLVSDGTQLYNTVNAEEFFNEHRFAPQLVGNRFLHAIPTALTTLGLLGTFLGLTIGLRGLDLGSTTDEMRVGIQVLVDGAALGFTASLWGVAMSLLTNVFERWQERRVVAGVRKLQDRIDHLFKMKSPEQSLTDIAAHTSESSEALQVLHEKIGSALQESVQHVGENTSRAVTDAIQSSLAPIMADLASRAADQSAEVFKEISGQLTASFNEIGTSLAAQLKESSESMRSTLDYMSEQLARQADQHLTQMNTMQMAAAAQLSAVTEATNRQITLLDESLPRVVSGLDRAATLVGAATNGMEEVATGLGAVTTQLSTTTTDLARMLNEAIGTMNDLATRTSSAADAIASQQSAVTEVTREALTAAQLLHEASGALRHGFDGLTEKQNEFNESLGRQLLKHSQEMAGWLAAYRDEVSKQTAHRMSEWNAQTERFTSTMLSTTLALSEAVDEMSSHKLPQQATGPRVADGVVAP